MIQKITKFKFKKNVIAPKKVNYSKKKLINHKKWIN